MSQQQIGQLRDCFFISDSLPLSCCPIEDARRDMDRKERLLKPHRGSQLHAPSRRHLYIEVCPGHVHIRRMDLEDLQVPIRMLLDLDLVGDYHSVSALYIEFANDRRSVRGNRLVDFDLEVP